MFELTQSMEWTRLEQTLQIKHFEGLLAIPIPDELVSKQDTVRLFQSSDKVLWLCIKNRWFYIEFYADFKNA